MQFYYNNISLRHYFPLFFLLCFSGNPLVTSLPYFKPLLAVYSVLFIVFTAAIVMKWKFHKSLLNYLVLLIGFVTLIVVAQQLVLGFVSYPGVLGFILNILLGLFTLLYYKHQDINFFQVYIKILAFLVLVSIPFWALNQIGFYGIELLDGAKKSFFFYTFFQDSQIDLLIRNSGMFWEPGAFAGYLLLGLIFVVWQNKAFQIGQYKKEVFWITVGLLTAMSTTGYIIFGIMVSIYSLRNFKWGKLIAAPIILLIIYWGYFSLPFMQDKITEQYTAAKQLEIGDVSNTRFGTIIMDLQYIQARPFIGNGLHEKTRYRFHPRLEMSGFGNGMSDFIADWGILLFLLWLYCIYRFAFKRTRSIVTSLAILFLIILILQGEGFLNFPIFLIFFTCPFIRDLGSN